MYALLPFLFSSLDGSRSEETMSLYPSHHVEIHTIIEPGDMRPGDPIFPLYHGPHTETSLVALYCNSDLIYRFPPETTKEQTGDNFTIIKISHYPLQVTCPHLEKSDRLIVGELIGQRDDDLPDGFLEKLLPLISSNSRVAVELRGREGEHFVGYGAAFPIRNSACGTYKSIDRTDTSHRSSYTSPLDFRIEWSGDDLNFLDYRQLCKAREDLGRDPSF